MAMMKWHSIAVPTSIYLHLFLSGRFMIKKVILASNSFSRFHHFSIRYAIVMIVGHDYDLQSLVE